MKFLCTQYGFKEIYSPCVKFFSHEYVNVLSKMYNVLMCVIVGHDCLLRVIGVG